MAPIIRTEKLRKVYAVGKERVVALNDVDLAIEKGEFCCIVGQSGSGKSTLLNQLAGLEKPTRGKVFIGKHEISAMNETELAQFRQQHLGFIFQSYNLLPTMTAAENVALPLMFKGIDKKTRLKLARKELKSMGLLGRANHLPTEMSGGQQQRVGIARAFVSNPKVIFADEPTGNLDSKTSKQVLYRMLELTKNQQVTFVMVTHEPGHVLFLKVKVHVLSLPGHHKQPHLLGQIIRCRLQLTCLVFALNIFIRGGLQRRKLLRALGRNKHKQDAQQNGHRNAPHADPFDPYFLHTRSTPAQNAHRHTAAFC